LAVLLTCAMAPAGAQLLGGGGGLGGLGGLPGGLLSPGGAGSVGGVDTIRAVGSGVSSLPSSLLSLRRDRQLSLVRENRNELDVDDAGNPIRRDEIVGINLSAESLAKATAA